MKYFFKSAAVQPLKFIYDHEAGHSAEPVTPTEPLPDAQTDQEKLEAALRRYAELPEVGISSETLDQAIRAAVSGLAKRLGENATPALERYFKASGTAENSLPVEQIGGLVGEVAAMVEKADEIEGAPLPDQLETVLASIDTETFLQDLPQEPGLDEEGKPTISRLDTVTSPRVSPASLEKGSDVRFDFMFNGEFNEPLWRNTTAGSVLPKKVLELSCNGQTYSRRGFGEFFNEGNQRLKIHGNVEHGHTELQVSKIGSPEELAAIETAATESATAALERAGIDETTENFDRLSQAAQMAALKGINVDLALALADSEVFGDLEDDAAFMAKFESALIEGHRLQDGLPSQTLEAINNDDRNATSAGYFLSFLDEYLSSEQRTQLLTDLGFEEDVINNAEQNYADGLEVISGDLMAQLKLEISSGEGNYESYNRGRAGDSPGAHNPPLTSMTFGEVMRLQSLPSGNPNRLFACGKYQLIPGTMREAVSYVGISSGDRFTPENQERLFNYLISPAKRPRLNAYITGRSTDLNAAHRDLAYEFASIPGPDGRGMYDGDRANNNAAGGQARARRVASLLSAMHNESV